MITYVLSTSFGDEVHITNYGARIIKWQTQANKKQRNIILSYEKTSDYLNDEFYLGAIVGPYANRIKDSRIDNLNKDNITINLASNEGKHQLHGGPFALSHQFWDVLSQSNNTLILFCVLKDGFNGYPGPIHFVVTYKLKEKGKGEVSLFTNIKITSKKVTIVGPTTHPYFNLSGTRENVSKHYLQLHANDYTELDQSNIPTGRVIDINNNDKFNFKNKRTLGMKGGIQKLDDNFLIQSILSKKTIEQAVLSSPNNDIHLHVFSNYPCLQVYTGEHLSAPFIAHQGICLEPQFAPNSPNQSNFTFELTTPERPLDVSIEYRLIKSEILD